MTTSNGRRQAALLLLTSHPLDYLVDDGVIVYMADDPLGAWIPSGWPVAFSSGEQIMWDLYLWIAGGTRTFDIAGAAHGLDDHAWTVAVTAIQLLRPATATAAV